MNTVINYFGATTKNHPEPVRPNLRGLFKTLDISPKEHPQTAKLVENLFKQICVDEINSGRAVKNYDTLINFLSTPLKSIKRRLHCDIINQAITDGVLFFALAKRPAFKTKKSQAYAKIESFLNNKNPQQNDFDALNALEKFIVVHELTERCQHHMKQVNIEFQNRNQHAICTDYNDSAIGSNKNTHHPYTGIDFDYHPDASCGRFLNMWMRHIQKTSRPRTQTMALT